MPWVGGPLTVGHHATLGQKSSLFNCHNIDSYAFTSIFLTRCKKPKLKISKFAEMALCQILRFSDSQNFMALAVKIAFIAPQSSKLWRCQRFKTAVVAESPLYA